MATTSWLDDAPDADETSWLDNAEDGEDPEAMATRLAEEKYEERKPSKTSTALTSFAQGATLGNVDEIGGAINSVTKGGSYKSNRDAIREYLRRSESENPKTAFTADLFGSAAALPAAATPLGAGAMAAGAGAARAVGDSDKLGLDTAKDAAIAGTASGLMGAGLQKFGPMAFEALGKITKPASDALRNFSGRQAVSAMKPTQGMIKDLDSKKLTEKVGNYALDEGIVNSYRSQNGMLEKARQSTQKYADETRPIYEDAKDIVVPKDQLMGLIANRQAELAKEPGMMPISKRLGKFGTEVEEAAIDSYNPSDLRKYRGAVSKQINFKTKPRSQMGADEMRKILREQEMGLIERVSPEARAKNEELFTKIRLGNEAEDVAERGAAQTNANNWIGLRSGIAAPVVGSAVYGVTGDEKSGAIATILTGGAGEVVRRYGNQVAASISRKASNMISSEKWRPLFDKAIRNGPGAVSSLVNQLYDGDSEFRALMDSDDGSVQTKASSKKIPDPPKEWFGSKITPRK